MGRRRRRWIHWLVAGFWVLTAVPAPLGAEPSGEETSDGEPKSIELGEESSDSEDPEAEDAASDSESSDAESKKEAADTAEAPADSVPAADEGGDETRQDTETERGPKVGGKRWPKDSEIYDPAWARYRTAFMALANGNRLEALKQLEALQEKYDDHPAALFAAPVAEKVETRIAEERTNERKKNQQSADAGSEPPSGAKVGRLGLERPTPMARAELVSFQTLHGLGLGLEFCVLVQCGGARPTVATLTVGGGAALGLSVVATRNGITRGHSLAINSGTVWGLWQGLAINGITRNFASRGAEAAPMMLGQLAGIGIGTGLYRAFRPNGGDVALVNAGGLWSGAFTLGFMGLVRATPDMPALFGTLMTTTHLGGLGGAMLARSEPMSRGRVYILNSGGLLGGLVGIGSVLLLQGDLANPSLASGMGMVGSAGGLGLAGYLTRDWDGLRKDSGPKASIQLTPPPEGRGAMLSLTGIF